MFVVKDEYVFTCPVNVQVPVDQGKHVEQTFEARFKIIPIDQAKPLYDGQLIVEGDAELLRQALVGWHGIVDADNQTVPFTPDKRDWLINAPFVRRALAAAYARAIGGTISKG